MANTFERVTGIRAQWRDLPLDVVRELPKFGRDLANMYAFFQTHGVARDLSHLRQLHSGLMTFEDWLRQTGWRGEPKEVQAPRAPG